MEYILVSQCLDVVLDMAHKYSLSALKFKLRKKSATLHTIRTNSRTASTF